MRVAVAVELTPEQREQAAQVVVEPVQLEVQPRLMVPRILAVVAAVAGALLQRGALVAAVS